MVAASQLSFSHSYRARLTVVAVRTDGGTFKPHDCRSVRNLGKSSSAVNHSLRTSSDGTADTYCSTSIGAPLHSENGFASVPSNTSDGSMLAPVSLDPNAATFCRECWSASLRV